MYITVINLSKQNTTCVNYMATIQQGDISPIIRSLKLH